MAGKLHAYKGNGATLALRWLVLLSVAVCFLTVCRKDHPITIPNAPPSTPTHPSPLDSAQNLTPTIELKWESSDPDGDPVSFDIYLGADTDPPKIASNVPECSYDLHSLAYETTYYWKIVAKDNHHNETSGPVWMFKTVTNEAPTVPSIPLPFDNAVNRPIDLMLSWHASDPEGDSLFFDLYFGTDNNPPLLVSSLTQNAYRPPALPYGTTFYWRVVARDREANETSGPVWTFRTLPNKSPDVPSNPSPGDGEKHQPLNVKLSWLSSDPEGGPLTYDVYFGNHTGPPLAATGLTQQSYVPGQLEINEVYYWRIVAKDDHQNERWGPEWSFATVTGIWREMESGITNHLNGVWGTGGTVFAVGDDGVILRCNGTAWAPMVSGVTNHLKAVWGLSESDVYAVGLDGRILHFDGIEWETRISGTNSDLLGIWGSSENDVFAVGEDGTILRYNGVSWRPSASGIERDLFGVWGTSGSDVFAVGAGGTILHFNGTSWNRMISNISFYLNDVWGNSGNDVFVVGYYGQVSHYDGTIWNTMTRLTTIYMKGVWGSSGTDVYAVGDSGTILHYNGTNWVAMTSGTTVNLHCIWGRSDHDAYAVGESGSILHYGP